jgi:hypothetical protein
VAAGLQAFRVLETADRLAGLGSHFAVNLAALIETVLLERLLRTLDGVWRQRLAGARLGAWAG